MKWLKDGLSIDETKASAMIIGFFISLGFSLYQVVHIGDISNNLLQLLSYLIMAITGISSVATITKGVANKTNNTPTVAIKEKPKKDDETIKGQLP